MATTKVAPPPGFVLDGAPPPPAGFVMDGTQAAQQRPGALSGVLSEVIKGMTQGGPPAAIARGLYSGIPPLVDWQNRMITEGAYNAGGAITDLAAKTGVPPEVSGGLGYATNVAVQAAPAFIGGELMRPLAAPVKTGARRLMQSAIKPSADDLVNGNAARAIETLLEKGKNPTEAGILEIRNNIGKMEMQVKSIIANSTKTVNKGEVGKTLLDTFNRFKKQVNPNADLEAIRKAWLEFRNHPDLAGKTEIPIQVAQDLKSGTYGILRKKYGQLGAADDEAQKGLARGLRIGISKQEPAVAGLNDEISKLMNVVDVVEKRALMEGNKNIGGLSAIAPTKIGLTAFLADRSALAKSLLARLLYSGSETIPVSAGRVGGLLYGTYQRKQHGH